jgi:hypothetical protein
VRGPALAAQVLIVRTHDAIGDLPRGAASLAC